MADRKISELVSATTIGAIDVVPIVQSNTTKQITASTLFKNVPVNIQIVESVMTETSATIGSSSRISKVALTAHTLPAANTTGWLTPATTQHGFEKEIFHEGVGGFTADSVITVTGGVGFTTITLKPGGYVKLKWVAATSAGWYVIGFGPTSAKALIV